MILLVVAAAILALKNNNCCSAIQFNATDLAQYINTLKSFVKTKYNDTLSINKTNITEEEFSQEMESILTLFRKGVDKEFYYGMEPVVPNLKPAFVDDLVENGIVQLKHFARQIVIFMKTGRDVDLNLYEVLHEYRNIMLEHSDDINRLKMQDHLDAEYCYLDMIETSTRLIYEQGKKLLALTTTNPNDISIKNATEVLNDKLDKQKVDNKKEEMHYLCDKYNICRHYPTFSDYFVDFVSEILKLPDSKFKEFLNLLTKLIKDNYTFFEMLSEKDDRVVIENKLRSYKDDVTNIRELFNMTRTFIVDKFKIIPSGNDTLIIKTKAVRLILDSIDDKLDSKIDIFKKAFEKAIYGLRAWAKGLRETYNELLQELGNMILDEVNKKLTPNSKNAFAECVNNIVTGRETDEPLVG